MPIPHFEPGGIGEDEILKLDTIDEDTDAKCCS